VFVVCCVGSGLCDKLITDPEGSYQVCVYLIVWDPETLKIKRPRHELGCCTIEKEISALIRSVNV